VADSITAMGSSPLYFPLTPNWATIPKMSIAIARDYVQFNATSALLKSTTELVPSEFTLSFMVWDKTSEYELLNFLHTIKGQAIRFWIEYPVRQFTLADTMLSGSTAIQCLPNGFEKISQGNERIFWAMKNGDLIVRKVDEALYDDLNDVVSLTIDTALDRDIAVDDYFIFGRFLLCRLSDATVEQNIETKNITTYSIKFSEVPGEYDEEEAS